MPKGAESSLVIVFARAPTPGRVKTRLAPLLGREGAARLHERMLERAIRTAVAARCGEVELHGAPGATHAFFRGLRGRFALRLRAQGRGGLGARMRRAFARALRRHAYVILIGSDCPALRPADLRAALRALRAGADAVLSPVEDGGYALLGLRRAAPELFAGVRWGRNRVLAQTRSRLARLGWRRRELRTLWDVDRPRDVARLRRSASLASLAAGLPAAIARPTS
ncbi:MAG: TIGR04282 family arsenosugar biosynthesis glycosyltransferase [Burkholderiales bacterium]|nr:TIGR04282 family arsenosugar biosynthesis glycosyltransferase [Burkholderiales bacterium]